MSAERTTGGGGSGGAGTAVLALALALLIALRLMPDLDDPMRTTPSTAPAEAAMENYAAALQPEAQGDLDMLGDIPRYRIDARFDAKSHTLTGVVQLVYTSHTAAPLFELAFDIHPAGDAAAARGEMLVGSVTRDDEQLATTTLDNGLLRVSLDPPLAPGQATLLVITFLARPGSDLQSAGMARAQSPTVFTAWYPRVAEEDPQAPEQGAAVVFGFHDVTLSAAPGEVVIAGGVEVTHQESAQQSVRRFVSGPARGLGLAVGPGYHHLQTRVAGVTLHYHALADPPGGRSAQEMLDAGARAFAWYAEHLGAYPYAELHLVEAEGGSTLFADSGGTSVVLVDRSWRTLADDLALEGGIATLMADQWWSGVTNAGAGQEAWLSGALSGYATVLFREQMEGAQAGARWLEQLLRAAEPSAQSDTWLRWGSTDSAQLEAQREGLLFLDELRQELGPEDMITLLSDYATRHRYRVGNLDDLLMHAEDLAGRTLENPLRSAPAPVSGPTPDGELPPDTPD
ncbi:MAG: gluzincin family metallopeptidase [Anaerolineae bacterium]